MKNKSLFDIFISFAYVVGVIIAGFALSIGLFFLEGFFAKCIYELYFSPVAMKSVMGVVFLTSFMFGSIYVRLSKILTILKNTDKKKKIPANESKEERGIREYFERQKEISTSLKNTFETIVTHQIYFLIILLFAWICHFFV